ncbi:hypothetical protein GCWU000325_02656 [Alloprevotella tannerae ATCC 51259]|uniref:Uncharacterized protein n=1 Tax=Alloprevotella tannerae ATCC 51259 TaxID=626522 RepID=C9LK91_9BACT|nr:hypothetical protein GCWU000325_02656 [Alloprevotella tannerae ATCC 51259]
MAKGRILCLFVYSAVFLKGNGRSRSFKAYRAKLFEEALKDPCILSRGQDLR